MYCGLTNQANVINITLMGSLLAAINGLLRLISGKNGLPFLLTSLESLSVEETRFFSKKAFFSLSYSSSSSIHSGTP